MLSNLYAISYKENNTTERDLVVASDILSVVLLYNSCYPDRVLISITYQSKVVV